MKTIKQLITSYSKKVILLTMVGLLVVMLFAQVRFSQNQARETATERFDQIQHVLSENQEDLEYIEEMVRQSHLRSADMVAYLIRHDKKLLEDTDSMRAVAELMALDEINIFDEDGHVFAGTHPEHIGMTFDSMKLSYFEPLLEDKTLQLCQDAAPDGHHGEEMHYTACWSDDGTFIVQVGAESEDAYQITEKYELSYFLSLLRVYDEAELYVISLKSGTVLGATAQENVGKSMAELGFDLQRLQASETDFHAKLSGSWSYCVFEQEGHYLYGRVIPLHVLYQNVFVRTVELTLVLLLFAVILLEAIRRCVDRLLIRNIQGVNETLRLITDGNLDERIRQDTNLEFSEMGHHINQMVESLNEKLEYEHQYQAELTEALKLADSANKSKSAFLFSMSHDIRTPMNAILGFADMAERHIDDRERVLDCLSKLSSAGDHLLRLVNDVLDMASIESGKMELKMEPHSIPDSLAAAEALFAQEMQKKNLTFVVSCDVEDEIAFCDALRIEQVGVNLLSNALKYTPEGGSVTYTVTQTEKTPDGYATYRGVVKDTGIGMTEEFCQRMFEPFEREQTSTVSGISGTGLGLTVAKRIIEQMGGTISCTSKLGEGSEFVFTVKLKVGTPEDLAQETPDDDVSSDFSGKRILLVEDNELNREIAYEILSDFGFAVETAEDGVIAVEKVSQAAPGYYNLILMDIQMPNMDGYQATEAIRKLENARLANIPIVAFTANAMEKDKKQAYAAGMNGHLAKPIDVEKMLETLNRFL